MKNCTKSALLFCAIPRYNSHVIIVAVFTEKVQTLFFPGENLPEHRETTKRRMHMTVHFDSLGDVREFVGLATLQPYAVQVLDGDRTVNAKSFMEMFTINFTQPLQVEVAGADNEAAFARAAKKFLR